MVNKRELRILLKKMPKLFLGYLGIAIGITLIYYAELGMSPWSTLQRGLENVTGISFGVISQLVGIVLIIMVIPFKLTPGIGTLFNMYFIGAFINILKSTQIISTPHSILLKYVMCIFGLFIFSYGIYLYLSCGLGAGPRDGLMIVLIQLTGLSASYVKPATEILVLAIGYFIGGPLGIGTAIITLGGGRVFDLFFKLHKFDPKSCKHDNLIDSYKKIFVTKSKQPK